MVDVLANDYASQPVVFIEYPLNGPLSLRRDRYGAALGSYNGTYPWIVVDSGHQVTNTTIIGGTNYYPAFQALVDAEMLRAPQADLAAQYTRVENHFDVEVKLTNRSGVTLSTSNAASLAVIVYEDIKVGVTSRYARSVLQNEIGAPLGNNETRSYFIHTPDLSGVDWNKLHILALVDYKPSGSGAYDMLQAAEAAPTPSLNFSPSPMFFLVDDAHPTSQTAPLEITSQYSGLTWEVMEHSAWLVVTPNSGSVGAPAEVYLLSSLTQPGPSSGGALFHITGPGVDFLRSLHVQVYRGEIYHSYAPAIQK